jgi:outer membrane protein assembly factor BamB
MSRPLMLAARLLWERLRPYRPAMIGGMTLSADAVTIALLYEAMQDGHELSGFLVRKASKASGLRKQVEGPPIRPGVRVALVDDLINSGATLNRTLAALEPYDPEVVAIAVVVDFEGPGSRIVREEGSIPFEFLFTLRDLGIRSTGASHNGQEPSWTWSASAFELHATPTGEPVIAGSWIYAAIGTEGLTALRDETEQWRFRFRSPGARTPASPIVHDETIYIGASDGYVYALSAHSGDLRWETPLALQAAARTIDSERGLLIIGGAVGRRGRLAALRIEDGFVMWEATAATPITAACIDPQRAQVIVGTEDGGLCAYDASAGHLRWMTQTRGAVRSMPSVDSDGRCFAGSGDGLLYALDADTGRQLWTRRLGRFVDSAPLVVGDLVVAGGPMHLVALERSTGAIRWVAATGGLVAGAVAAGDVMLIGGSTDGGVYILDRESGSIQSRYPTGGAIRSRPAVDGDQYVVASSDGKLYGFRVGDAWHTRAHPMGRPS